MTTIPENLTDFVRFQPEVIAQFLNNAQLADQPDDALERVCQLIEARRDTLQDRQSNNRECEILDNFLKGIEGKRLFAERRPFAQRLNEILGFLIQY